MDFRYELKSFDQLSLKELYEIMVLRQEVFVVEQDCPYLDADGKDYESHHLSAYNQEGVLVAYTRLVPEGISYKGYSSIGRVVNKATHRKLGIGKEIMIKSIAACKALFPDYPIKISAQCYLLGFYGSLGFEEVGEEYLEDDIPHKAMIMSI